MNNKERYLKFIKDFNGIGITDILKELNLNSSSFYTFEYSIENMQKVTNKMRENIEKLYIDINHKNFILDTKEDNVNFIKDLKNISINNICDKLNISKQNIYSLQSSDSKYEMVVNEIRKQIGEVYEKYSKNT